MSESLWDAMERLRMSAVAGLDQLDAHVRDIKERQSPVEAADVGDGRQSNE